MAQKVKSDQAGFSLLEVMIALAIFAVYSVAIITTQSSNIDSSQRLKNDLLLHNLAEMKMNEALVNVKKFTNATENDPDTGNIEIEGFKEYKFEVQYKKNKFPNFADIMGKEEEDSAPDPNEAIRKSIFEKLKKNVELMLWQVTVTITSPEGSNYSLSSWLTNNEAKLDTNFGL